MNLLKFILLIYFMKYIQSNSIRELEEYGYDRLGDKKESFIVKRDAIGPKKPDTKRPKAKMNNSKKPINDLKSKGVEQNESSNKNENEKKTDSIKSDKPVVKTELKNGNKEEKPQNDFKPSLSSETNKPNGQDSVSKSFEPSENNQKNTNEKESSTNTERKIAEKPVAKKNPNKKKQKKKDKKQSELNEPNDKDLKLNGDKSSNGRNLNENESSKNTDQINTNKQDSEIKTSDENKKVKPNNNNNLKSSEPKVSIDKDTESKVSIDKGSESKVSKSNNEEKTPDLAENGKSKNVKSESDGSKKNGKKQNGPKKIKGREANELTDMFDVRVDSDSFEKEHVIGVAVILENTALTRKTSKGRKISRAAPKYFEQREFHKGHVGTGNSKNASEFRAAVGQLLENGQPGEAIILNQQKYEEINGFIESLQDPKGKAASYSFFNMIKSNPSFSYTNRNNNTSEMSLSKDEQIKCIAKRLNMIGKSRGENFDISQKDNYESKIRQYLESNQPVDLEKEFFD